MVAASGATDSTASVSQQAATTTQAPGEDRGFDGALGAAHDLSQAPKTRADGCT